MFNILLDELNVHVIFIITQTVEISCRCIKFNLRYLAGFLS